MKKFVGNVNGMSFTDRDDFNKAVKKAVESGEMPLVISSYETECECQCNGDCKCKKSIEVEKKPFDVKSIRVFANKNQDGTYTIPSGLTDKLRNEPQSVIDEIYDTIGVDIDKFEITLKEYENKRYENINKIKSMVDEIDNLKKCNDEFTEKIDDIKRMTNYYITLMRILIDGGYVKKGTDDNTSGDGCFGFCGVLDKIGFWKK